MNLIQFQGPVTVDVFCVEDFAPYRPHPHILTGDHNLDGIHYQKTVQKTKKDPIVIDFKFGIMSVRKDHMRETLIDRYTSPEEAQIPTDPKYKYKGNIYVHLLKLLKAFVGGGGEGGA